MITDYTMMCVKYVLYNSILYYIHKAHLLNTNCILTILYRATRNFDAFIEVLTSRLSTTSARTATTSTTTNTETDLNTAKEVENEVEVGEEEEEENATSLQLPKNQKAVLDILVK